MMEIAKALILAGSADGHGQPPVVPGSRYLFPVANRPILFHNLEAVQAAGVLEATILTDIDSAPAIECAVADGRDWGLTIRVEPWRSADGLRGALSAARKFVGDEPVLVEHADALLRGRMHGHISAFARERLDALELRLEPSVVPMNAPLTPGYLLSPRAVAILADGPPGADKPVASLRAHGGRVRVEHIHGCLPCHGDVDALIAGNRCMLEGIAASVDPVSLEDSTVHGAVQIHPSARIRRSLVRGPAIVGPDACLTDAYIGPYTSVGAGVVVEGSEIEHSILLPEAELRFVGNRLESSVIGRRARVVRGFALPAAMRVTLGDDAEVVLQ